ncbi:MULTISPECIES: hypothetical protein [unclassified Nonomuraea]
MERLRSRATGDTPALLDMEMAARAHGFRTFEETVAKLLALLD